uniref:Uncharacterized protein n=1 Tax=Eutreptiella gymnastica TaxID=73025 RepID=A0A7S4CN86_9EUGL
MACTWDASSLTARLYFDGAAVASAQSTGALAAPTSVAVQIGALDGAGGTGRWTGELDELMVWNKTLHPQEAYKLYQGFAIMHADVWCESADGRAGSNMTCRITLRDDFGALVTVPGDCKFHICPLLDGAGNDVQVRSDPVSLGPGVYEVQFTPYGAGDQGIVGVQWEGSVVKEHSYNVTASSQHPAHTEVSCSSVSGAVQCATTLKDEYGNHIGTCVQNFADGSTTCP